MLARFACRSESAWASRVRRRGVRGQQFLRVRQSIGEDVIAGPPPVNQAELMRFFGSHVAAAEHQVQGSFCTDQTWCALCAARTRHQAEQNLG